MKPVTIEVKDKDGNVILKGLIQDFRIYVDNCVPTTKFEITGLVVQEE